MESLFLQASAQSKAASYPNLNQLCPTVTLSNTLSLNALNLLLVQTESTDVLAHSHIPSTGNDNVFGLRATVNRIYLDDANPLKLLEDDSSNPNTKTFEAITHNVLHPMVAYFDKNPKNRNNTRFIELADYYKKQKIGLLITQESTQTAIDAFEAQGFCSINADKIKPIKALTQNHWFETKDMRSDPERLPSFWTRSQWRGLSNYYRPEQFQALEEHPSEFLPYPTHFQKGWRHIFLELFKLFKAILLLSSQQMLKKQFRALICSLSGIAREDGLLITPLQDKNTKMMVFLCNTHLESFDHDFRLKQLDLLMDALSSLHNKYPQALIFIGADFNYPQKSKIHQAHYCFGLKSMMASKLNAHTLSDSSMCATLNNGLPEGADIDGLYLIPPEDHTTAAVGGKTLLPLHKGQDYCLSDHCAVALGVRLTEKNPQSEEEPLVTGND